MLRHSRQTAWCEDPKTGGVWVLSVENGEIYALPPVGLAIWQAADGAEHLDDVVSELATTHGWEPDVIREPVRHFITDLVTRGLLRENRP